MPVLQFPDMNVIADTCYDGTSSGRDCPDADGAGIQEGVCTPLAANAVCYAKGQSTLISAF